MSSFLIWEDTDMDFEFCSYEFRNELKEIRRKVNDRLSNVNHRKTKMRSISADFDGRTVLDNGETNELISSAVQNKKALMAARLGAVELNYIYQYLKQQKYHRANSGKAEALRMLCFNAGFFPKVEEDADKLARLYLDSMSEMDLCGVWGLFMEDYMIHAYAKDAQLTQLAYLEPWNCISGSPWSKALKGKKLLIIHPFTETMEKQYNKRERIFANRFDANVIFPSMEIKYLKAVQSIGGQGAEGFNSWFDAYSYMLETVKNIDFDVAILGCGAYGFPLSAEIKKMGKVAIHLGGATQLMFGIRGKRWDSNPSISSLYNEAWVSPDISEKPKNAEGVEGGCYW